MTHSQRVLRRRAKEHPDYLMCGEKSVPGLVEKATTEAKQLVKELSVFYNLDVNIAIEPKWHELCWSIAATLIVNGQSVLTKDPCDLLFLELNNLMLKHTLFLRGISFDALSIEDEIKIGHHLCPVSPIV